MAALLYAAWSLLNAIALAHGQTGIPPVCI